jgi:hypothetical protein
VRRPGNQVEMRPMFAVKCVICGGKCEFKGVVRQESDGAERRKHHCPKCNLNWYRKPRKAR